jgi:hypothetical protein
MATYKGISSEAFRHPLDSQAEQALRSLPGFDFLARKFVEFFAERPQLIYLMGNTIQLHYLPHVPRMCTRFGYLS